MQIKKLTSVAISLVAAQLLWTAPAQATLISDTQNINTWLTTGSSYDSTVAGTSFDLRDNGVPVSATVNWANVSFSLVDVDGNSDSVSAVLEGYTFYTGTTLGQSVFGFTAFGGLLYGNVISALNSTGVLDYTLNFLGGGSSVLVRDGVLVADITSVPEPATLLLLGSGLLAIGFRSRRRAQA